MLPVLLLLPFLGAALFYPIYQFRPGDRVPRQLTLITTGAVLVLLAWATFAPGGDAPREFFAEWIPAIGLHVSLWLDGPALFFSWIIAGIGFLIFYYSGHYMDPKDAPWRFYATMLLFMGAMLGVVMSRNVLLMFLFWEVTSLTSFILIGHWHERKSARQGALQALIVTALGGLCLLAGIAGVYWILMDAGLGGPHLLDWDQLWLHRDVITSHGASFVVLVLLLLGAFTKSAQFPFQFWLPGAMEAPTPVSAFLHAATMVKAGIYLLGRLYPVYWAEPSWLLIVGGVGVVTMLIGGFMAIVSTDLKQLLAHSTVSQLGLITAYYGFGHGLVGTEKPLPLDLALIASHALFKGGLFMIVGIIDHGTHTREWPRLGGLRHKMPWTFALTLIGCASMAGFPFTFGFVAKELFLKGALEVSQVHGAAGIFLFVTALLASLFTVAYCIRMVVSPFFGKPRDPSIDAHEGGAGILAAPAVLILLTLLGGLYVPLLERPIATLVEAAHYGKVSGFTVGFFHHVDVLLLLAVILFTGGAAIFLLADRIASAHKVFGSPAPFRRAYEWTFEEAAPAFAAWLCGAVQQPSLQRNIAITSGVAFGLIGFAAIYSGMPFVFEFDVTWLDIMAGGVVIMAGALVLLAIGSKTFVVRLIAISPIGPMVALFYLFYKAPDLALTQILVEVSLVVMLLLLLFRLPQRFVARSTRARRIATAAIAITGGLIMGALTFVGQHSETRGTSIIPGHPPVNQYYLENAFYPPQKFQDNPELAAELNYPGAGHLRSSGGRNVVNVILVDFRGFDTLGEILVLGISAVGLLVLLVLGRDPDKLPDWRSAGRRAVRYISEGYDESKPPAPTVLRRKIGAPPSLIMRETGRFAPAIVLVFAVVLFFAGHNAPGGGFIAGLMSAAAFAILLLSFRKEDIRRLHDFRYLTIIPAGMAVALGTGLVAVAFGLPFLTSGFTYLDVPFYGEVEVTSAIGFDLGVYLTVVGSVILIIKRLGQE